MIHQNMKFEETQFKIFLEAIPAIIKVLKVLAKILPSTTNRLTVK